MFYMAHAACNTATHVHFVKFLFLFARVNLPSYVCCRVYSIGVERECFSAISISRPTSRRESCICIKVLLVLIHFIACFIVQFVRFRTSLWVEQSSPWQQFIWCDGAATNKVEKSPKLLKFTFIIYFYCLLIAIKKRQIQCRWLAEMAETLSILFPEIARNCQKWQ